MNLNKRRLLQTFFNPSAIPARSWSLGWYPSPMHLVLLVGLGMSSLAHSQQIVDEWTTVHGALNATPSTPVATQIVNRQAGSSLP